MAESMYEDDLGPDPMRTRKKLSGKRLLLFVLLPLILIVGGLAAALHFDLIPGVKAPWKSTGAATASAPAPTGAPAPAPGVFTDPIFLELPDIIVNLRSEGPRPSFLKLSVAIEVESTTARQALEKRQPRVIDAFQTYLRELTPDQLRGAPGLARLRQELLIKVQQAVQSEGQPRLVIRDVLFKEMLVQ